MYILSWHKTLLWVIWSTDFHWDTWFNGHLQRKRIKTRFCCRGHLLPTVKTNVYLYTDLDIFKTRHQIVSLFLRWRRNEKRKKGLWENLRSRWEDTRGCGHTKTGLGSQRQAQTSFKTTSLFDYWRLCNGNGLWNQWTCVTLGGKFLDETELKCLQLPLSPFCPSLSFSGSASASALWWTVSKFQDRMDRHACFISPSSCCYPFHFLVLVSGWQVKLSSQMAAPPSFSVDYIIWKVELIIERGAGCAKLSFLKRQLH